MIADALIIAKQRSACIGNCINNLAAGKVLRYLQLHATTMIQPYASRYISVSGLSFSNEDVRIETLLIAVNLHQDANFTYRTRVWDR